MVRARGAMIGNICALHVAYREILSLDEVLRNVAAMREVCRAEWAASSIERGGRASPNPSI